MHTHLEVNDIYMGLDVEVFLQDRGRIVPAEALLPFKEKALMSRGYKEKFPVEARGVSPATGSGKIFSLHADGVTAEITAGHMSCRMYLIDNLQGGLIHLNKIIKDYNTANGTKISVLVSPAQELDVDTFDALSPRGKELGCDPERNIYIDDGKTDVVSTTSKENRFRYAGGHIHLGFVPGGSWCTSTNDRRRSVENLLTKNTVNAVKLLDMVVATYCILLEEDVPGAIKRREIYGRPGSFRPKNYGLEYRVLSNLYLLHPAKWQLIFGLVRETLSMGINKDVLEALLESVSTEDVIQAIMSSDKRLATKNLVKIRKTLKKKGWNYTEEEVAYTKLKRLRQGQNTFNCRWNLKKQSSHGSGLLHHISNYAVENS